MRLKRLTAGLSAAVLGFSSLLTISLTPLVSAASGSDTCTWTGATDNKFSTVTNWSGCSSAAPVSGDNLVFDVSSLTANTTLNNDISNLDLAGIKFSGNSSSYYNYTISGSAITLSGNLTSTSTSENTIGVDVTLGSDVTVSSSGSLSSGVASPNLGGSSTSSTLNTNGHKLTFNGVDQCGVIFNDKLAGAGSVVADVSGTGVFFNQPATSFTGSVTANSGLTILKNSKAFGSTSGVNVKSGAGLVTVLSGNTTYGFPLTLAGSGTTYSPTLTTAQSMGFCAGGGGSTPNYTATFSGHVTLNSDVTFSGDFNAKVTGTYTSNGHKITTKSGSVGSITTPDGTSTAPKQIVTIKASDKDANKYADVGNNQTYIIDGTRGGVTVEKGGTLKGSGSVGTLDVFAGGTVAPGHSPGCLSSKDLTLGGVYQAELGGDKACSGYDQLKVTGSVTIDNLNGKPVLDVSLYGKYLPKKGDQYVIISNDGKDAVNGTFQNLAEGATFKVGNAVFKISYKGGDGNDVVLTALNTPTAPDTGFAAVTTHPLVTFGVVTLATGAIIVAARRSQAPARRR